MMSAMNVGLQIVKKHGEALDDAKAALVMLGFNPQASRSALKKFFSDNPALTTEKAIKLALTML